MGIATRTRPRGSRRSGGAGLLAQAPLSRAAVPFPVEGSAGQGDLRAGKARPRTRAGGPKLRMKAGGREDRGAEWGRLPERPGPVLQGRGLRAEPQGKPGYLCGPRHCPGSLEAGGHPVITGGGSARLLRAGRAQMGTRLRWCPAPARSPALLGLCPRTCRRGINSQLAGRLREARVRGLRPRPGPPTGLGAAPHGWRVTPATWRLWAAQPEAPGPVSRPGLAAPPDTTSVTSDPPWGRQRCPRFPGGTGGVAPGGLPASGLLSRPEKDTVVQLRLLVFPRVCT